MSFFITFICTISKYCNAMHCYISLAVWVLTNIFECEAPDDTVPAALGVEEGAGDADL